jgi:outer membrane immunogenic protein
MLAATRGEFMKNALLAGGWPRCSPPALYNWTGCYGGGHFGTERSPWSQGPRPRQDSRQPVQTTGLGALGSNDGTGLVVGGQLGCNYQLSTWVFGIQGDAA